MNQAQTEDDGTPEFSFDESNNWIKEQHRRIKNDVPEKVQPLILEKLEVLDPEKINGLEKKGIEVLIDQSLELKKLLVQFEHHLAKAAQSKAIAETEIELFWEKFELAMLDPNEFKPRIKNYLDERYAKHAKETAVINETQKKALEASKESEAEMADYAPYYFTTAEREKLYSERANAEKKGPKALAKFKEKLVKLRQRKESYTKTILSGILANKHRPVFCQRELEKLEKKCGAGIFELPSVANVKQEIERPMELYNQAQRLKAEGEAINDQFYEEFGHNLPGFKRIPKAANDNIAEIKEDSPEIEEAQEQKEAALEMLTNVIKVAENSVKKWGEKSNSRTHAMRGPAGTMSALSNGEIEGYTLDSYMDEIKNMPPDIPCSAIYASKNSGAKRPEVFFDIPSDTQELTSSKISNLNALATKAESLSPNLRASSCLFYVDYYKDPRTDRVPPSIFEFISFCKGMMSNIKGKKAA